MMGFGAKTAIKGPAKKVAPKVTPAFGANDDDDKRMKPLIPIEYSQEEIAAVAEIKEREAEKKKAAELKELIQKIPTEKEELFAYKLNWAVVQQVSGVCMCVCCSMQASLSHRPCPALSRGLVDSDGRADTADMCGGCRRRSWKRRCARG